MTRIRTPVVGTGRAVRHAPDAPRPHLRDGTAALFVAALVVLEALALRLTPVADWPLATVALGAALAAVAVTAGVLCHGRRVGHRVGRGRRSPLPDDALFDAGTRRSCPLAALRPALPPSDPTAENRLYAAWVLARHGRDAAWLSAHLDLPAGVADTLVRAADAERAGDGDGHGNGHR
ncbi:MULTISPECIES: hypothetical protein [Streptomyces]|uniref:hypothetical protein n=1 Tax=Streptomyces TaxID=1883 RepID=UPI00163D2B31|nr:MULTISPECIES: hypothetical protein [Streptomyces]MBC2874391.1 hypothetical protein [Streptomyces sp. TYQ1024]UBI40424.1 hypothetical protein K7I03_30865 [Streptomyces mobaraensis]UKW33005.1 hypothetical protein MCU78_30785 [Streptomyces sp. TYQ1024]